LTEKICAKICKKRTLTNLRRRVKVTFLVLHSSGQTLQTCGSFLALCYLSPPPFSCVVLSEGPAWRENRASRTTWRLFSTGKVNLTGVTLYRAYTCYGVHLILFSVFFSKFCLPRCHDHRIHNEPVSRVAKKHRHYSVNILYYI
jgi:hypothetical protein